MLIMIMIINFKLKNIHFKWVHRTKALKFFPITILQKLKSGDNLQEANHKCINQTLKPIEIHKHKVIIGIKIIINQFKMVYIITIIATTDT